MVETKESADSQQELIQIETLDPIPLFVDGGLEIILSKIEEDARSIIQDMTTPEGRKQIASHAYKIARSKTTIDDLGKKLVSDWKTKAKFVDSVRKGSRDRLDALRDEIRKPLNEWENKEKDRVTGHEKALEEIMDLLQFSSDYNLRPVEIQRRLLSLQSYKRRVWDEFQTKAIKIVDDAELQLQKVLEQRTKFFEDQAELEKLRQEKAERDKADHEAKIALEALEKDRIIREKREQELKEKLENNFKENKAALDKVIPTEEQIEKVRDEVVHESKIHDEIVCELVDQISLRDDIAKEIVTGIIFGTIPHLKIIY